MNRKRKAIIEANEVSQLYEFELGGYKQKVLIEGKKKSLPIVISLHGGPGTPIPFSVGCRGMFEEFTSQFLMVYWDQYGCGINNAVIDNSFTIAQFVEMTQKLIEEVKKLFPDNPIYIFATSWGSVLSAKLLEQDAKIVDGVVVWGQIVKNIFYNEEVYQELRVSKLPQNKLEKIKTADIDQITTDDLKLVSGSIRKYTNGYENKNGKKAPMSEVIFGLMSSPDYRMKDFKAVMVNGYLNNLSLWREILSIDLTKTIQRIQIPYVMIQGDTDIVASAKVVQELVMTSENPCISCQVVKDSGHYPGVDGMEAVMKSLANFAYADRVSF